jgi:hypothetical protein
MNMHLQTVQTYAKLSCIGSQACQAVYKMAAIVEEWWKSVLPLPGLL